MQLWLQKQKLHSRIVHAAVVLCSPSLVCEVHSPGIAMPSRYVLPYTICCSLAHQSGLCCNAERAPRTQTGCCVTAALWLCCCKAALLQPPHLLRVQRQVPLALLVCCCLEHFLQAAAQAKGHTRPLCAARDCSNPRCRQGHVGLKCSCLYFSKLQNRRERCAEEIGTPACSPAAALCMWCTCWSHQLAAAVATAAAGLPRAGMCPARRAISTPTAATSTRVAHTPAAHAVIKPPPS